MQLYEHVMLAISTCRYVYMFVWYGNSTFVVSVVFVVILTERV